MTPRPFRPADGPYMTSAVLTRLAQFWDDAHHRMADRGKSLTQKDLARASDVPMTTVNSWAKGVSLPRELDKLAAVGRVLAQWADERPLPEREWDRLLRADQSARQATTSRSAVGAWKAGPEGQDQLEESPRYSQISDGSRVRRRIPPFLIPPIPANHEDREDLLAQAKVALLEPSKVNAARMVGLVGMGGAGKSVIARSLARDEEIRHAFPDGIVWLELGPRPNLLVRQAQLAEVFGDSRAAIDMQLGLVRLNDLLDGAACLIVLDNVWKREHLRPFELLESRSALLVTTRNRDIFDSSAVTRSVGSLSEEQSRRLLAAWAGQDQEDLPAEAEEIAQKCGGLPLALAIAGGMVDDDRHSWHYVLERLRQARLDKLEIRLPDYRQHPDLLRVLDASVSSLIKAQRNRFLELAVFEGRGDVPVKGLFEVSRDAVTGS